ncbi:hypothetical protein NE237_011605 [Protea cynaroides]|uniref:Uncharacterized protein n=1 Tax=Protea cynaroides TaxID=273540 RepID=A0A9Q0GZF8_9MAGN|nr:hypothetical protein NE237_011605 [Protea cynaroides]
MKENQELAVKRLKNKGKKSSYELGEGSSKFQSPKEVKVEPRLVIKNSNNDSASNSQLDEGGLNVQHPMKVKVEQETTKKSEDSRISFGIGKRSSDVQQLVKVKENQEMVVKRLKIKGKNSSYHQLGEGSFKFQSPKEVKVEPRLVIKNRNNDSESNSRLGEGGSNVQHPMKVIVEQGTTKKSEDSGISFGIGERSSDVQQLVKLKENQEMAVKRLKIKGKNSNYHQFGEGSFKLQSSKEVKVEPRLVIKNKNNDSESNSRLNEGGSNVKHPMKVKVKQGTTKKSEGIEYKFYGLGQGNSSGQQPKAKKVEEISIINNKNFHSNSELGVRNSNAQLVTVKVEQGITINNEA